MKDVIRYTGILLLIIFSFYYTDRISTLLIYKSSLMKKIINNKDKYEIKSSNAIINDDNIIPGLNGIKVDEIKSYYKMKKQNIFNKDKLVYNEISPKLSIENNKKYIIKKGKSSKKSVSLMVKSNKDIIKYSIDNNIDITLLVDINTFNSNTKLEQINIDIKKEKDLDILLNKYKKNTNLCNVNYLDKNKCIANNKYLFEPTYELFSSINFKNKLNSGDIILISDNMNINHYKLILREIKYRDLKIVSLSKLISEKIDF